MDNFNLNEVPPQDETGEPIPFDDSDDEIREAKISHVPLDLGDVSEPVSAPASKHSRQLVSSPDRITGVKAFYAKLHAGAIDFLSSQITDWLAENPSVVIKQTNAVVGEIAAKKTEPNLIITVWF